MAQITGDVVFDALKMSLFCCKQTCHFGSCCIRRDCIKFVTLPNCVGNMRITLYDFIRRELNVHVEQNITFQMTFINA